jgi:beta-1,4-N-acetylglucosaminyltransferase
MIFVTVGNDFRNFDRLLKKMDEISPLLPCEVLIQKGHSAYHPKNTNYFDFVPKNVFMEYLRKAKVVVSHAGIGTIILCREERVPLLILPRRKRYGEHMNDHQLEIARALEEREGEPVYVADEESQLEEKILIALKEGREYTSMENPGRVNLIRTIREFIKRI